MGLVAREGLYIIWPVVIVQSIREKISELFYAVLCSSVINTFIITRIPEQITYKFCVLVYNCLHGSAPRYLQEVIQPVAEVTSRRRLRSSSSSAHCPAGASNATYHTWWPSVCRRWASCLEYPTRLHHRLLIIAHFQTISQDLSIQSIILST